MASTGWVLTDDKFLNGEEVARLRKAVGKGAGRSRRGSYLWFLVELGLQTGLRVQEMASLKCGDFHLGRASSFVEVRCGKGGRSRMIKTSHSFTRVVGRFFELKKRFGDMMSEDAPVFANSGTGGCLTKRSLQLMFKECVRKASLPTHFAIHCLRHTYGTHLYKASKFNLRFVQKQLGHARSTTTEVYADVLNEDENNALEGLYKSQE